MTEKTYGWTDLNFNPLAAKGKKVKLEGLITGSFIEVMGSEPGVQTVISPHPTRSGLAPLTDDMGTKVIVFLPGELSDAEIASLRMVKHHGGCLYVEGDFKYEPRKGGYAGRLTATTYENR